MQSKDSKLSVILFIYIIMIIIKDYFVDLYFYMQSNEVYNIKTQLESALVQSILMIIYGIICCVITGKNSVSVGSENRIQWKNISVKDMLFSALLGVLCFFSFNVIKNAFEMLIWFFTSEKIIINNSYDINFGVFVLISLIIGGWFVVGEELVYRKVLCYDLVQEKGQMFGIIFGTFLFVMAHNSVEQMIQALFVALVLNTLVLKKRSLIICMLVHCTYNICGLICTYFYPSLLYKIFAVSNNMNKLDILIASLYMLLMFLFVVVLIAILIKKYLNIKDSFDKKQIIKEKLRLNKCEVVMIIVCISFIVYKCYDKLI